MGNGLGQILASLSARAFEWTAILFLLLNGLAAAAVLATRSRDLVNRWTGRYVAANVALLSLGLGVPLIAQAMRFVVSAMSAAGGIFQSAAK